MPILKGKRYPHTKVYRPNGTRYAEGQDTFTRPRGDRAKYEHYALNSAVSNAVFAFRAEFGDPTWERVVVEISCDSTKAVATLYEIPDDREERE